MHRGMCRSQKTIWRVTSLLSQCGSWVLNSSHQVCQASRFILSYLPRNVYIPLTLLSQVECIYLI